jgi:hypothetical protein
MQVFPASVPRAGTPGYSAGFNAERVAPDWNSRNQQACASRARVNCSHFPRSARDGRLCRSNSRAAHDLRNVRVCGRRLRSPVIFFTPSTTTHRGDAFAPIIISEKVARISRSVWRDEGELSASIEGPTTGHWIYEKGAGDYALTSGTAFFWPHQRNRTSTAVAVPADGNGLVNRRSCIARESRRPRGSLPTRSSSSCPVATGRRTRGCDLRTGDARRPLQNVTGGTL